MNIIHREGYPTILITLVLLAILNGIGYFLFPASALLGYVLLGLSVVFFLFILSFFRNPNRQISAVNNNKILAPADGKVVVIEEVEEPEYFKDKRLQVSIFMSPANVHVNRNPISGVVKYTKYHPGKYLVAWHPKSSTENERFTSVVACKENNTEILFRQIAGKLARKICNYLIEGQRVVQGNEFGFIKFGSRVDIFLPIGTKVTVNLEEVVKGNQTVIAEVE